MNNIEINDKLETDIENKYIKFKENVKFTTEEAIYILKRKDFCDEVENIAIENLIQENKELKENPSIIFKNAEIKIGDEQINKYIVKNYIPKSKVKEKIDYLKSLEFGSDLVTQSTANLTTICILQELLEEGE